MEEEKEGSGRMNIYGPFAEDGGVVVGIVGTKEHAKIVSDELSARWNGCDFLDRIRIVVPKKGASTGELLSAAADTEETGKKSMLWMVCSTPEKYSGKWPSETLVVEDFLGKAPWEKSLPFVPRKCSLDEACDILVRHALSAENAENAEKEILKLRAEKTKHCRRADDLETSLESAKTSMDAAVASWSGRTKGMRVSTFFSIVVAATLFAAVAFGVKNPDFAYDTLVRTGEILGLSKDVEDGDVPARQEIAEKEAKDEELPPALFDPSAPFVREEEPLDEEAKAAEETAEENGPDAESSEP